jgi:hypothetical protein
MESTTATLGRTVTNDIFLAAYLLSEGGRLVRVLRNERRRASFVFEGDGVAELKQAYVSGPVFCDIRSFRHFLNQVRDLLPSGNALRQTGTYYPAERSMLCFDKAQHKCPPPLPRETILH